MADRGEEEGLAPPDPCIALRLVTAAAWHAVQERQVHSFPQVLALLDAVWEAAPGLVHYRHLAKLRLGLQAKVIMTMLQEELPDGKIYDAVDTYFPENEPQPHPNATAQDLKLVQAAQENFRDLVLGLLSDCRRREKYVQEHLETDYGATFVHVVEELFCDYLWELESTLPEPCFQEILLQARPLPDTQIPSARVRRKGYLEHLSPVTNSQTQAGVEDGGAALPLPRKRISKETIQASTCQASKKWGEYQCTHHNTLIPTFQELLQNGSSQ
ncbi:TERF1-interacting nuclear factor 2 isoform X6 [Tiliqua scincoides]|uniref:TERF1-interacting nuclear factor 2 isoform X6 n=1 Tax=Tiliqua scincoides TaxID=71010 RepID=UPI00346338CC